MKREIIQQHLSNILGNIASINQLTELLSFNEFQREDQIKEEVYSRLQEIGQASTEIINSNNGEFDLEFDIEVLFAFKNARYNMEAEMHDQSVWSLIKGSLNDIAAQIEESERYQYVVSS